MQVSWSATREIESFVLCPNPTEIFSCPACCFEWHASRRRKASGVLGSPTGILVAHGQARNGLVSHLKQHGVIRIPAYIQKGNGRLHLHGETCHHFALFSYLHPGNKVKSEDVTEKYLANGVLRHRFNNGNLGYTCIPCPLLQPFACCSGMTRSLQPCYVPVLCLAVRSHLSAVRESCHSR